MTVPVLLLPQWQHTRLSRQAGRTAGLSCARAVPGDHAFYFDGEGVESLKPGRQRIATATCGRDTPRSREQRICRCARGARPKGGGCKLRGAGSGAASNPARRALAWRISSGLTTGIALTASRASSSRRHQLRSGVLSMRSSISAPGTRHSPPLKRPESTPHHHWFRSQHLGGFCDAYHTCWLRFR